MSLRKIKNETSLEEVISQFTEVVRQGPCIKAICPFHNDSRPSLNIFSNGRWRCFVCNIGGDVIDFIKQAKGISTKEAASWLEKEYGIQKDASKPPRSDEELKKVIYRSKRRLSKLDYYLWDRYREIVNKPEPSEEEWKWLAETEKYRTNEHQDKQVGLYEYIYLRGLKQADAIKELKEPCKPSWYVLSVSKMSKEASEWFHEKMLDKQIQRIKSDARLYMIASIESKEKDPSVIAIKLNADNNLLQRVATRYASR